MDKLRFKILKLLIFKALLLNVAFAAEPATQSTERGIKPEEITAAVREKLSPIVEATLQDHCGEDCPSFKIDTQFKKNNNSGILDDLGFSKPTQSNSTPELQTATITVLVQDKVPQTSRESLRQILAHRTANESPIPIHITLKPLSALSPFLEKLSRPVPTPTPATPSLNQLEHQLTVIKTLAWPICLLIIAVMSLLALLFFLKNRRDLLKDRIRAFQESNKNKEDANETQIASTSPVATNFLENRTDDLFWLVEDLANREDYSSLNKVLISYQPQELTSKFKFSNSTLRTLASMPNSKTNTVEKQNTEQAMSWLKDSLDQVHWKRIAEQNLPLTRLARLSDEQCADIFANLKSLHAKAVFIGAIPEGKWPYLLSQLTAEDRVEIGLALSRHQASDPREQQLAESLLSTELETVLQVLNTSHRGILENFTLYLTEKEGQQLWQQLSQQSLSQSMSRKPPTLSIDALIQELTPAAAAEIFSGLEIGTSAVLMSQLSPVNRQKILTGLPRSLKERIQTQPRQDANEAQTMRARAHLLDAYRRFSSGSLVQ
jgi:hypothetical protein